MANPSPDLDALRDAIGSGDPSRAMPALVGLRTLPEAQAIPLLLLGLEQQEFMVRSLSCAGLGVKQSEVGWLALVRALQHDDDANVRAEAANSLVSHSLERSWPLVRDVFAADEQWLVRCSILSALAEQPGIEAAWLFELAEMAIADGDGTVRVGGTEILGRLVRDNGHGEARLALQAMQSDSDHRVVAAALNGLQA
ncbi:HEAT repeat domain-containing protein [Cyanobium sp. WAJ14-Wanaka]|uniref:HEAT repeat domain-containing protein n=1 Tax=Cyanobium sp. WAJ14-Wanaka TaxID=2823725 RepID=UPI0020CEDCDF|nr:HEAT repeat domain-containing protein [Cyanobium sp. WAJ14-Wanaka]MCP9775734.1 HEAT repeat domain-containing protein [Cyanobium sp. WAJ14-Wanaka]